MQHELSLYFFFNLFFKSSFCDAISPPVNGHKRIMVDYRAVVMPNNPNGCYEDTVIALRDPFRL